MIGYVVIMVFLLVNGLFLWVFPGEFNILDFGYSTLDSLFVIAPFVFLFLIPAITMRSFAEEKRSGTIELLLTRPLTDLKIIMAKYMAGLVLVIFSLLPTLVYLVSVYQLGQPAGNLDMGGTWGSYIGLLFLGAGFVAIGLFASSVTDNQIFSFVLAVLLCGFLYVGFELIYNLDLFGRFDLFIQNLGMQSHYISMSRGVIDTRDVFYSFSVIFLFLTLTHLSLGSRKWKRGGRRQEADHTQSLKRNGIVRYGLGIMIMILVNVIGSQVYTRFDLTAERRYSLTNTTRKLLKDLDDIIYFKVYLDGDFPAGFKRLRNSTKEMLDEFRAYSGKIQYEFINPSKAGTAAEVNAMYEELIRKGLNPTDLQVKTTEGSSQQIIFPGAIVSYQSKEFPLDLLQTQIGLTPEAILNQSVQTLEHNLSSIIYKLTLKDKPAIAFIEGHGELEEIFVYDITGSLSEYYQVERTRIDETIASLTQRDTAADGQIIVRNRYAAIIIAQPDSTFSEKDKFIIDQYIMYGGKVLWLIDPVYATMDSLESSNKTIGLATDLGLDDLFFNYGVRLNQDLLLDLNALPIRVVTGMIGNQPQINLEPWYFFPVVFPYSDHPIVSNLNAIMTAFVSSMDTVTAENVQKTILVTTSEYARVLKSPVLIDLSLMQEEVDPGLYRSAHIPIAVLLEGEFESLFKNRIPPQLEQSKLIAFRDHSIPTAMIVISDGDVIRNQLHVSQGYPLPLGFDQYTRQRFGNRDFIMNAVNYLCDDSGLIDSRSKDFKLRLLDKTRVNAHRAKVQSINTSLPVVLVLLFGIFWNIRRRGKYHRFKGSQSSHEPLP